MRALIWFRNDLRVHDNRVLTQACRFAEDGAVGVFAICGQQWRRHDWSSAKVSLILRTLAELSKSLDALNIPLVVVEEPWFSGLPARLLDVARKHRCDRLFYGREYEWNERLRDEAVSDAFERAGIGVIAVTDRVLFEPGSVRTKADGVYTVYSPFRRAVMARWAEEGLPGVLPPPRRLGHRVCEPDPVPTSLAGFDAPAHEDLWPGGEAEARRRLDRFVQDRIDSYKHRRDLLAEPGTSELSPYLAIGAVSVRACLARAAEAAGGHLNKGPEGACTWINQLLWREFYTHVMAGFPRVSKGRAFRVETEQISWVDDDRLFQAWASGCTGYPVVDAGMRQLLETGWMHNRARMIAASFLTKDLGIDWRRGERHFMQHLVDGDLANNNGGWQWSASTGTDAQPYFRVFNPVSQGKRFDPRGEYVRCFVPELSGRTDAEIHEPIAGGLFDADYPPPIVDHAQARAAALRRFGAEA
ncbi:MAG: deoxyribodipyrimidine photo-lyase [Phycisphaerales bacterium]